MKKIILSLIVLLAIDLGAFVAWSCYHDMLALALFFISLLTAHWFEEGRQELKKRTNQV